ncbi:hypothetical protein ACCE85_003960 [Photobacterium damselae]
MSFRFQLYWLFICGLLLWNHQVHAMTNIGTWYQGAGSASYTSLERACASYADYNNASSDRYHWALYNITDHEITAGKYYCNLTRDGEIFTPSPIAEIELAGWRKGAGAVRYRHDAKDLTYDILPFWSYSRFKATTPKAVCDYIIEKTKSPSYEYIYSHMEVYHVMRYAFTPSWFQCIAKKRKVQKDSSLPPYPWGYVFVGTAKTEGTQEGTSGGVSNPCDDSSVCSGGSSGGDSSSGSGDGGTGGTADLSGVEAKIRDLNTTVLEGNVTALESKTELVRISTDILGLDAKLSDMTTEQIKTNTKFLDLLDKQEQSNALLKSISETNPQIVTRLHELKTETGAALGDVITTIRSSSADEKAKLMAIESALSSLENSNAKGYESLNRALSGLTVTTDNSDTVAAINGLESSNNAVRDAVTRGDTSVKAAVDSLAHTNSRNAQAIVSAINGIHTDGGGTVNVDMSSVNDGLKGVKASITDLGSKLDDLSMASKQAKVEPDKTGESFWDSAYPNGFKGIWQDKKTALQQTRFVDWLNSFKLQFGGSSDVPNWNMCFDLGMADFGCHDFSIDSRIWGAIRTFILITAAFLCRRLVFGG